MKRTITMSADADARTGTIEVIDRIGKNVWGEGYSAEDFRNDLEALGDVETINVTINSRGGSVTDGAYMYDALSRHPAKINVHIAGYAMSMGSALAMVGDHVTMSELGAFMMHKPLTDPGLANADALRDAAEVLDTVEAGLMKTYQSRSGLTDEEVTALLREETTMSADEAKTLGFIDEVVPAKGEIAAELKTLPATAAEQASRAGHAELLAQFIAPAAEAPDEEGGEDAPKGILARLLAARTKPGKAEAVGAAAEARMAAVSAEIVALRAEREAVVAERDSLKATLAEVKASLPDQIAEATTAERERVIQILASAEELGVEAAPYVAEGVTREEAANAMLALKATIDEATAQVPKISDSPAPDEKKPATVDAEQIFAARRAAKRK